jgi:hypothetical protein
MEQELGQAGMNALKGLEDRLSRFIQPVNPDPEFIDTLRTKITHPSTVILETGKRRMGFLVIAAGLVTGVLVVWLLSHHSAKED